jgi:hypothetical protein
MLAVAVEVTLLVVEPQVVLEELVVVATVELALQ